MASSALILFREGLEGALIVAIAVAYLRQLGRRDAFGAVWAGVASAVVVSLVVGVVLSLTVGELEGRAEQITEGIVMFAAAAVLTWMIFWMRGQARSIKGELHARVDRAIAMGSSVGLAAVVFFGVAREGIETALFFIAAATGASTLEAITGGVVGLAIAIALGVLIYRGSSRLNLRQFFTVSGALLLLLAAGLLTRSLGEFQEAGVLPLALSPAYDISGAVNPESFIGELLHDLLGFTTAPTVGQSPVWLGYIVVVGTFYIRGIRPTPPARAPSPATSA